MLYIVPTPVGNLEDITLRAIRLLKTTHIIISEDTRHTRKLMKLLEIENKPKYIDFTRNHEFNLVPIEAALKTILVAEEEEKEPIEILVVSDSGTPGISDPGIEIIRLAQDLGVNYTVLPGATAFVPAVVASGITGREFTFLGFLPVKKGRQTQWKEIVISPYPVVFYESVHRIDKCVGELKEYLEPTRKISICREVTKMYETIWIGTVSTLEIDDIKQKGEFVIIVDKAK
ncbi:MAG: 16S rRNA (cytidine(1402)-2'-O)-methyltransferase [candidate division SR1 bacterium]|nr:16S rRNA (cytidine(1402)-2'-O)-methyltransferase [candidate division SR1 bacterium]